MKISTSSNDYAVSMITFPANTSREDFDRMKIEIQAALEQAEHRGEQKALAFIRGEGRGTMEGWESLIQASQDEWQAYQNEHFATGDGADKPQVLERSVKARFRELLEQHPELTRGQAYIQAVLEMGDAIIAEAVERTKSKNDQAPLD